MGTIVNSAAVLPFREFALDAESALDADGTLPRLDSAISRPVSESLRTSVPASDSSCTFPEVIAFLRTSFIAYRPVENVGAVYGAVKDVDTLHAAVDDLAGSDRIGSDVRGLYLAVDDVVTEDGVRAGEGDGGAAAQNEKDGDRRHHVRVGQVGTESLAHSNLPWLGGGQAHRRVRSRAGRQVSATAVQHDLTP